MKQRFHFFKRAMTLVIALAMLLTTFPAMAFANEVPTALEEATPANEVPVAVEEANPADDPTLELWLRMDETSGTNVHDSSGNNRHATLAGNAGTGDWIMDGDGLDLWGTASGAGTRHVVLPRIFEDIPGDFTITTEVYFRSGGAWSRIFDFGPSSTGNIMFMTANTLQVNMSNANALIPPGAVNNTNNANRWRSVTVTHIAGDPGPTGTPGTTIIYINGVEVARGTQNAPVDRAPAAGQFFIGRANWAPDPAANMQVRDFRVYSRALPATEIAEMYMDFLVEDVDIFAFFDGDTLPDNIANLPVTWTADAGIIGADGRLIGGTDIRRVTVTADFGGVVRDFPIVILPVDYWDNPDGAVVLPKSTGNNPITWPEFTADPAPVVIDDTVWLIGGRDMGGTSYNIPHYVAYSSKDLINWTYHGVVLSASDVSWLSNDSAWAAHMVPYTGTDGIRRYYLYTCGWGTGAGFSGSTHLGVAVADHPAGPYVDIGQPLMHSSVTQTPPGIPNDHGWADIDPMVFITEIDGEERRFITWGNERFRIAELNEDMISLKDRNGDGQITNADISDMLQGDSFRNAPPMPPGMFHFTEGPWLHERDGIFYVFYAGGWYEDLSYARALDIYGPWYHSSRIMEPTATSNTNHPGVIDFNGRTYLFYHNGMQPGGNGHGRSVSIVEIKFDDLGFIYPMHELSIGVGGTASTLTLANDDAIGYDWFENPRGGHPLFRDIRVDEGGEHVSEAAFRTEWEIVQGRGRDGDTFVSLQAVHKPGLLITATSSADTQLTQDIYGANFAMAQTFRTLEGATEHGVRFESYLFPGMFLTNVDGDLVLTDGLDAAASTFYVEEVNVDPHRPMPAHNGVVAYPFDSFVPDTNPADDPDLEIWLRMDETAGTVVHDSSVHGRHAALAGNDGTGYWNPEHNSLDLWGVATGAAAANQRHVVLPRIFQHIPDDFTISTDVYFRSGATWARLFDFGPGSTGNLVFMTANTLQTNMSNANALTPPASFNNTNNPSQWRTVTLTHTAGDPGPTGAPGTTVIYIDGIEVARGPQNVPINRNPATGEFFIGRANWPDPTPNMMVRDFRIYSRALSDADVFHHFRAPGTTVWDLFDVPARVPGGFELPTEVVGQPVIWVSSVPEALEDGRLIVAGTNEQEIVLTATIGGQTRTFPVTVFSIWHGLNLPHRPWNGFELPAAHAGQPLTWTAPEGVLDVDGRTIVITPSNDDREVTLTATIDGLTRDFTVTLPSIWDDLRMMRYKADGCVLPTRLAGVPVTWESSDPTVLDGNVIVGHADTREGVILTATRGNLTREYTVTVLGADVYQAMPPVGSSDRGDGTFANPFSFSDVPDMSIIRVGDAFWMASTTMHMMPGVPIKKSYDLVNWEIVSYCYLILEDVAQHRLHGNSHIYGMGTWASSLRHRNDTFYLTVFSNVPGRTYVFQNTDPENLPWERHVTDAVFHDMSVLFDDDGRNWMVWDDNPLLIIEMNEDMTGVLPGATQNVLIPNLHAPEPATGITPTTGLAEGAQLEKINGLYYLFAITWPPGQPRTIVVHRAANLEGPWEARVVGREAILHPDMVTGGSGGIAQGSIVQDTDGNWWGYAFRDSSAGGRMPWLMQVTWRDGWPYFGVDAYGEGHWGNLSRGGVKPMQGFMSRSLVTSDEFYNNAPREAHLDSALPTNVPRLFEEGEHDCNGSFLDSRWQWNHNPNNNFWSLTERPGWLRLHAMLNPGTTNRHLLNARNTLTQRTFGPYSSAITRIDVSNMQDGDEAGISLFTQRYGSIGVTMENGERTIVTRLSFTGGGGGIGGPGNIANTAVQSGPSVPLEGDVVYLKAEVDFLNANMNPVHATRPNTGRFFYSYDGLRWTQLGESLPMVYAISNHFMGYRYALFNFATESTGGFVDFDFFRIYDKMWGTDVPTILNAEMDDVLLTDVDTADVPLRLDPLPAGAYGEITASIYIPDGLEVRDVTFGDAVVGTGSFTVAGNQLKLLVSGPTVGFSPADMDVFAIITVERVEPLADNSAIIPDNINVRGGAFVAYDLRGVAANIITEDEMMSLVLETVTAAPGESVEVSISVENNVGLSTADIHIEFADDDIELVGRRRGLFAAPTFSGGP
ncbi:MAG: family 43 glycosylhydrolase, partial [Oscillospiraceae bacterium]|nr:family 43 glycosylhydrolase [Oscillospiraceae bacterium]